MTYVSVGKQGDCTLASRRFVPRGFHSARSYSKVLLIVELDTR
jgi:hypothetical protein